MASHLTSPRWGDGTAEERRARRTQSFGESAWTWREERAPLLLQARASGVSDVARKGRDAGGDIRTSVWDMRGYGALGHQRVEVRK